MIDKLLLDKRILSLLVMGSKIFAELNNPQTVSYLWEKARDHGEIKTFEEFVLTLDLLYMLGLIELEEGFIRRIKNDKSSL